MQLFKLRCHSFPESDSLTILPSSQRLANGPGNTFRAPHEANEAFKASRHAAEASEQLPCQTLLSLLCPYCLQNTIPEPTAAAATIHISTASPSLSIHRFLSNVVLQPAPRKPRTNDSSHPLCWCCSGDSSHIDNKLVVG